LHTLVEERRAVLLLVDRDRERLTTAVVLRLDDGHVEPVGVVRQLLGASHAGGAGSHDEDPLLGLLLLRGRHAECE